MSVSLIPSSSWLQAPLSVWILHPSAGSLRWDMRNFGSLWKPQILSQGLLLPPFPSLSYCGVYSEGLPGDLPPEWLKWLKVEAPSHSACPEFILPGFSSISHTSLNHLPPGQGGPTLPVILSFFLYPEAFISSHEAGHALFLHPLILWVYKLLNFRNSKLFFSLTLKKPQILQNESPTFIQLILLNVLWSILNVPSWPSSVLLLCEFCCPLEGMDAHRPGWRATVQQNDCVSLLLLL